MLIKFISFFLNNKLFKLKISWLRFLFCIFKLILKKMVKPRQKFTKKKYFIWSNKSKNSNNLHTYNWQSQIWIECQQGFPNCPKVNQTLWLTNFIICKLCKCQNHRQRKLFGTNDLCQRQWITITGSLKGVYQWCCTNRCVVLWCARLLYQLSPGITLSCKNLNNS